MEEHDPAAPKRSTSFPSMIAWLSVCLLAAAWGHTLDDRWQSIWLVMGSFGLAAAVGLGAVEKARSARQARVRNCATRARLECGLARLNEHGATLESINAAVIRVSEFALRTTHGESLNAPRVKRRWQSQLLKHFPIEITPVEDRGDTDCELIEPIPGTMLEVSSRSVSFDHTEPFGTHLVLLTFKLGTTQQLSFVVDVLWTERLGFAYTSGGTVLAVGVPAEEDLDQMLAVSAAGSV